VYIRTYFKLFSLGGTLIKLSTRETYREIEFLSLRSLRECVGWCHDRPPLGSIRLPLRGTSTLCVKICSDIYCVHAIKFQTLNIRKIYYVLRSRPCSDDIVAFQCTLTIRAWRTRFGETWMFIARARMFATLHIFSTRSDLHPNMM
jgi:hypothetical protein